MNLFQKKTFKMHSGETGLFKIECDALTEEDLETIAFIISQEFDFKSVIGVPTGGLRLAEKLQPYCQDRGVSCLIVDDVLTTGRSMEEERLKHPNQSLQGVVIFSRGRCPKWVKPVFQMTQMIGGS